MSEEEEYLEMQKWNQVLYVLNAIGKIWMF